MKVGLCQENNFIYSWEIVIPEEVSSKFVMRTYKSNILYVCKPIHLCYSDVNTFHSVTPKAKTSVIYVS